MFEKQNVFILFCLISLHHSMFAQEDRIKSYLDSAAAYRLSGDTMEVYYLSKAIALQPFNAGLYESRAYAKAYSSIKGSKYGAAASIKDFDLAIKLDPKNAVLYEQRGYQKYLLGRKNEALKDLSKAIKLDKNKASFYRKRGDIHWDLQYYPRAVYDFIDASTLDTASLYNFRKAGDSFYEMNNFYDAIRYYNVVLKKARSKKTFETDYNEDYVLAYLYKANSNAYIGRVKESIKDYTQVINYNEKFLGVLEYTQEAYRYRGLAYLDGAEKEKGCEDLKTAESLGDKEAKELLDLYCK